MPLIDHQASAVHQALAFLDEAHRYGTDYLLLAYPPGQQGELVVYVAGAQGCIHLSTEASEALQAFLSLIALEIEVEIERARKSP